MYFCLGWAAEFGIGLERPAEFAAAARPEESGAAGRELVLGEQRIAYKQSVAILMRICSAQLVTVYTVYQNTLFLVSTSRRG